MIRVPSPSKLNLFLHITGRRPDGYHELQSIFQLIDLCDWLEFKQTADKQIQIEGLASVDDGPAAELLDVLASKE